jgi:UDP-N-acetylmuramate dehydrogenase
MAARLADLTTLRVGGPIGDVHELSSESDIVDAVRTADAAGESILILGGGSNVVCGDNGFAGQVLHIASRGIVRMAEPDGVFVMAAAGESWDELVAWSVAEGLAGIEAMAGIPGLVGATPLQNVGAYGQDISEVCGDVVVLDRTTGGIAHLSPAQLQFGYRTSALKRAPDRYVVLSVTLILRESLTSPVRYQQVADALGVSVGDEAATSDIRDAVLALRRAKGMVLDPTDHDSWSVGSFFTNPIVDDDAAIDASCPRYPAAHGVKLSAAWLMESAGIERGWGLTSAATISTKHVLALTNRGGATAADVLALAGAIRERVQRVHGITLEVEPRLIGCALN